MIKKERVIIMNSAVIIGFLVGILDYLFGSMLLLITDFRQVHFWPLILGLPLAGILVVWLYKRFGSKVNKGMTLLFDVSQHKSKNIPIILIPLIMISTWVTHLFGGSAGREGVAVQIGGAVGTQINQRIMKIKNTNDLFLLMGMAAGFGGLFQTPISAAIFSIEVFQYKKKNWKWLPYVLLSSYVANFVTKSLGLEKFFHPLSHQTIFSNGIMTDLINYFLLFFAIYIVGKIFTLTLSFSKQFFVKLISNPYYRVGIFSLFLVVIFYQFHVGRYSGLGTNLITEVFDEQLYFSYDWLLKGALTIVTLSIGFQGGEVTPLFAIGATFGAFASSIFNLPMLLGASLGYVGVFVSASATYLTGFSLALEVFGYHYLPIFALMIGLFKLINSSISIYPSSLN